MINISFDNIYFLFLGLPLVAAVLVPYFIAIRKENASKSVIISLAVHLAMVLLVTFAAAGTKLTTVITKTRVYVLADVSYSASKSLDEVDERVGEVKKALPGNSEMTVIAFGKDQKTVTGFDEDFVTVKNSGVDDSTTDIVSAIRYAASTFEDGVINRIMLITDGKQTDGSTVSDLIAEVEQLNERNVYIDAIYIDDNLAEGEKEVQISGVNFVPSTYINSKSTLEVMLQSASDNAQTVIRLYKNGKEVAYKAEILPLGYSVVNFEMPSNEAGVFGYEVKIDPDLGADGNADTTQQNNSYRFTQSVAEKVKVLLVTTKAEDKARATELYGDSAEITAIVGKPETKFDVPFTVEDLIAYDEIVLSEVDVRYINNCTAFVSALDTVVAKYGKSLLTYGNLEIQNRDKSENIDQNDKPDEGEQALSALSEMLPVRYGNDDQDPKFLGLVIDASRSMEFNYKMRITKASAKYLVDLLRPQDFLNIVVFWGDSTTVYPTFEIGDEKQYIKDEIIDKIDVMQGTLIGSGMEKMANAVASSSIESKQVILLSDGKNYSNESSDPVAQAQNMAANGAVVSTIIVGTRENEGAGAAEAIALMKEIATEGGGLCKTLLSEDEVKELVLSDIAEQVTESVINARSAVSIKADNESVLDGVTSIPSIGGYIYAKARASATTVLSTQYITSKGASIEVPVYAYRKHLNGRVSSFTSTLTGEWVADWTGKDGSKFLGNAFAVATPKERLSQPYEVSVTGNGKTAKVELVPATLNYEAIATIKLTAPDGTVTEDKFVFNSSSYIYEFNASEVGKYTVGIKYAYTGREYTGTSYYEISYLPEYDAFVTYDISDLKKAIRDRGSVYEDGNFKLVNDDKEVATWTLHLTLPFMIAAVVLFVADVVIRKLRWIDIVTLFKRRKGGQK